MRTHYTLVRPNGTNSVLIDSLYKIEKAQLWITRFFWRAECPRGRSISFNVERPTLCRISGQIDDFGDEEECLGANRGTPQSGALGWVSKIERRMVGGTSPECCGTVIRNFGFVRCLSCAVTAYGEVNKKTGPL